jgi:hypothetical protein
VSADDPDSKIFLHYICVLRRSVISRETTVWILFNLAELPIRAHKLKHRGRRLILRSARVHHRQFISRRRQPIQSVVLVRARGVWIFLIYTQPASYRSRISLKSSIYRHVCFAAVWIGTTGPALCFFKSTVPVSLRRPKLVHNRQSPKYVSDEPLNDCIEVVDKIAYRREPTRLLVSPRREVDGLRVQIPVKTNQSQANNNEPHIPKHFLDSILKYLHVLLRLFSWLLTDPELFTRRCLFEV